MYFDPSRRPQVARTWNAPASPPGRSKRQGRSPVLGGSEGWGLPATVGMTLPTSAGRFENVAGEGQGSVHASERHTTPRPTSPGSVLHLTEPLAGLVLPLHPHLARAPHALPQHLDVGALVGLGGRSAQACLDGYGPAPTWTPLRAMGRAGGVRSEVTRPVLVQRFRIGGFTKIWAAPRSSNSTPSIRKRLGVLRESGAGPCKEGRCLLFGCPVTLGTARQRPSSPLRAFLAFGGKPPRC